MIVGRLNKYSVVDLFAGAGGLSYGFLQTGRFVVKAAFESNHNAQITYERNHSDAQIYDDVSLALTNRIKNIIGKVDVMIGGPPCQGFSNANRQKNHAISQNNSLVKKFVQAVLHLNPTAFVMENVSMLQSNVHRFYVDANDVSVIKEYSIKTSQTAIHLLDAKYLFSGVVSIVSDRKKIEHYVWSENEYISLNVIFKFRNKTDKLINALNKHKNKLLILADKLIRRNNDKDRILHSDCIAGATIKKIYDNEIISEQAQMLCSLIEPAIMYQRMLSKAKEIHENQIIVSAFSESNAQGLVAEVNSMAVIDYIESILGSPKNGYAINKGVLSAAKFGVPQKRMRFVMIGVKREKANVIKMPIGNFNEKTYHTVKDAIGDLEDIDAGHKIHDGDTGIVLAPVKSISKLGKQLRNSTLLFNHVTTETKPKALERFKAIKQGENFHTLDDSLKTTYSDPARTQNTIYLRLNYREPSGTVVNVRKSMWIHPVKHRALSIREAARLQTFPDSFVFYGTKDSQYQQIGNAVPPMLAKAIAEHVCSYLDA